MPSHGRIELVIAQPTGVTEDRRGHRHHHGRADDPRPVPPQWGSPRRPKVLDVARSFRVAGDEMRYTLEMGAVGLPLQHHLAATLHRRP